MNSTTNDILQVQGINSKGFGIIPKLVMQDKRLTVEAKAIYAYFCSYAGAGQTAFPGRDKIVSDLGMGVKRYYSHFDLLKEFGYIKVEQVKSKSGKFTRNLYTLMDIIPCSQNDHTAPCSRFAYTDNDHTKSNSSKNNNSFKKERGGAPAPAPSPTEKTYGDFGKVRLTDDAYNHLMQKYGGDTLLDYIGQLDRALADGRIKPRKNHAATIESWILREAKQPAPAASQPAHPPRTRFANFTQRTNNHAKLERLMQQQTLKSTVDYAETTPEAMITKETSLNCRPVLMKV